MKKNLPNPYFFLYLYSTMGKEQICLGVDISRTGLKVALVDPKRKKIIKTDSLPASGDPLLDTSIYASVLSSWVRTNLQAKFTAIAVSFPAVSGLIRTIEIPKEAEDAMDYVKWEFSSAVEPSKSGEKADDFELDIAFYPNENKAERATLTALNRKLVDSFSSPEVEKSGFRPSCLMADLTALLNLLEVSEGLGSSVKCVIKADAYSAVAVWGDGSGPLAFRVLDGGSDALTAEAIIKTLENGFSQFPKAKRIAKLCGELSQDNKFSAELAKKSAELPQSIKVSVWNAVSRFSLEKNVNFSKLSECVSAIGATLNCI